jgi:hypothetical protein
MANKEEQGSFDFGDAKEINTKHQAELSKQMIKDLAEKKIDMEEFRERAKNLTVGKPGKEAREAKTLGLSKSTGKGGGAGGAGGFEDPMKKGVTNKMPSMKAGGKVSSASSRGDGCAQRGKTRGTMVMCGGGMAKGKKK